MATLPEELNKLVAAPTITFSLPECNEPSSDASFTGKPLKIPITSLKPAAAVCLGGAPTVSHKPDKGAKARANGFMKKQMMMKGDEEELLLMDSQESFLCGLANPMITIDLFSFASCEENSRELVNNAKILGSSKDNPVKYTLSASPESHVILLDALCAFLCSYPNMLESTRLLAASRLISCINARLLQVEDDKHSTHTAGNEAFMPETASLSVLVDRLYGIKSCLCEGLLPIWEKYRKERLQKLLKLCASPEFIVASLVRPPYVNPMATSRKFMRALSSTLPEAEAAAALNSFADNAKNEPWFSSPAIVSKRSSLKESRGRFSRSSKSIVQGVRVGDSSPFYALSLVMMVGMRTSIESLEQLEYLQRQNDFQLSFMCETQLLDIRRVSLFSVPYLENLRCCFVDLCPSIFRQLRRKSGITDREYFQSLCRTDFKFIEFLSNSKSGKFFFFSHDGYYLIKTVSLSEVGHILSILPYYAKHMMEKEKSLLARIFGLHHVALYSMNAVNGSHQASFDDIKENAVSSTHFIVLGTVFDPDYGLHQIFDLKGSNVGRKAKPEEMIKKDEDWMDIKSQVELSDALKHFLLEIHQEDTKLLRSLNIFDYSVLLGVHDKKKRIMGEEGIVRKSVKTGGTLLAITWAAKLRRISKGIANKAPETCEKLHLSPVVEGDPSASSPPHEAPSSSPPPSEPSKSLGASQSISLLDQSQVMKMVEKGIDDSKFPFAAKSLRILKSSPQFSAEASNSEGLSNSQSFIEEENVNALSSLNEMKEGEEKEEEKEEVGQEKAEPRMIQEDVQCGSELIKQGEQSLEEINPSNEEMHAPLSSAEVTIKGNSHTESSENQVIDGDKSQKNELTIAQGKVRDSVQEIMRKATFKKAPEKRLKQENSELTAMRRESVRESVKDIMKKASVKTQEIRTHPPTRKLTKKEEDKSVDEFEDSEKGLKSENLAEKEEGETSKQEETPKFEEEKEGADGETKEFAREADAAPVRLDKEVPNSHGFPVGEKTDAYSSFGLVAESIDGQKLYFVGIIDFLTPYTTKRIFHTIWKRLKTGCGGEISPVPANRYCVRQQRFLKKRVFVC